MSMRTWGLAVAGIAAGAAAVAAGAPPWNFDTDVVGQLPDGFTLASTRQPSAGQWFVQRDLTGGWLVHRAQTAVDADGYALALAPGLPLDDVSVSVRLRLVGGERSGGVLWRYRDAQNYYMAVLDLSEKELELYRIYNGNRATLDRQGGLELDSGAWHRLKIVHVGSRAAIMLDGVPVFEERDRRGSALGPGAAGLVATGESEVWFDDLTVEPEVRR